MFPLLPKGSCLGGRSQIGGGGWLCVGAALVFERTEGTTRSVAPGGWPFRDSGGVPKVGGGYSSKIDWIVEVRVSI